MSKLTDRQADLLTRALDRFNFARVCVAMDALDWTWGMGDSARIPSVGQMREAVTRLAESAVDGSIVTSGGFTVSYNLVEVDEETGEKGPGFTVTFVLEEASSCC